jgi:hypothetical protein
MEQPSLSANEFAEIGFLSPKMLGGTGSPVLIHLYVENVDEVYKRALSAGVTRCANQRISSMGNATLTCGSHPAIVGTSPSNRGSVRWSNAEALQRHGQAELKTTASLAQRQIVKRSGFTSLAQARR